MKKSYAFVSLILVILLCCSTALAAICPDCGQYMTSKFCSKKSAGITGSYVCSTDQACSYYYVNFKSCY